MRKDKINNLLKLYRERLVMLEKELYKKAYVQTPVAEKLIYKGDREIEQQLISLNDRLLRSVQVIKDDSNQDQTLSEKELPRQ